MERRPLGASGIEVSALSLGSWRTFERIPKETGVAVMTAARELGIDFLDDARYDDVTGAAPLPTGYSEVVFGELFRAAGWKRDAVVVGNSSGGSSGRIRPRPRNSRARSAGCVSITWTSSTRSGHPKGCPFPRWSRA